MAEPRGLLVSIEGVDGAGKSTQVAALAASIGRAGRHLTLVREPGGTQAGELIRDLVLHHHYQASLDPWTEALLMVAARAQLLAEVVRPALERGDVVLADRFVDSTLAYQGGGRGLSAEVLRRLHRDACDDLWPDRTILLALSAETAATRRASSHLPLDRMESDGATTNTAMMVRVGAAYASIAAAEPERIMVVDAGRPAAAVSAEVWNIVAPLLAPGPATAAAAAGPAQS